MPVSIVVGGQYGSEGKGKVALHIARTDNAVAVVRVGGPNSGHTGVDDAGEKHVFRQLPAASLANNTLIIIPAGSLIDADIILNEIRSYSIPKERILIDSQASVIHQNDRDHEISTGLVETIGSTGSGTGAALIQRISRSERHLLVRDHPLLNVYARDFTPEIMNRILRSNGRIVIEGTQGFGLSLWHGGNYPFATSRDTTASAFLAETGLSPRDVDDVTMVLRAHPIRVAGNSGPLPNEISWPILSKEAGLRSDYVELTSATRRVRRVARFDATIVRKALIANNPNRIVLNHMDYIDPLLKFEHATSIAIGFLNQVEKSIDRRIDLIGTSDNKLLNRVFFDRKG